MQLKEIMTTHVQGISDQQSACEAAKLMERLQIGSVPVFCDGHAIGIVTDRDIVTRAVACGRDCSQTPVRQIMTGGLATMSETTEVSVAVDEMERRQIRRLLITGPEDEIVGVVSVGDIVAKTGKHNLSAELIEKISVPAEPARQSPVT
ncbi:CBS domain-containing protein [Rubripirellula reticaptiva]|uniref:Hypoxic response protein 1 n=1 Tax=Rubripirellula reticaptiva TaxID=2528013 RepID=A0A5C6EL84_9BACT|nr:CBS domain-containing protein [Rubripirellula reticaptiva]TWU48366.1 Hypoxic response protein 1 [Rubripirellula reticaptiva]